MQFGLSLVTAPADEPVSLDEAKAHLRVDLDDEDELIAGLIRAAREQVEADTWRALVTQAHDLFLDRFPEGNKPIRVPLPPLQSVASVKYLDAAGVQQTFASSKYKVDTAFEPGRILLKDSETWPDTVAEGQAVEVRFTAGYGDPEDVPESAKTAVKLLVAHWYENREAVAATGAVPQRVPYGYQAIASLLSSRSFV